MSEWMVCAWWNMIVFIMWRWVRVVGLFSECVVSYTQNRKGRQLLTKQPCSFSLVGEESSLKRCKACEHNSAFPFPLLRNHKEITPMVLFSVFFKDTIQTERVLTISNSACGHALCSFRMERRPVSNITKVTFPRHTSRSTPPAKSPF